VRAKRPVGEEDGDGGGKGRRRRRWSARDPALRWRAILSLDLCRRDRKRCGEVGLLEPELEALALLPPRGVGLG
jgi:hypothetical protein